ncbi:MAG TPA: hypothetical protein VN982_14525 [Candidatus Dormibacteraeota bacterium]|nr:hypothetical protein [Candidatus Dormibacteraeota bacterium]
MENEKLMKTAPTLSKPWLIAVAAIAALSAILLYAHFRTGNSASREELLKLIPPDSSAVIYADLQELRAGGFLAEIFSWAPRPPIDADYAEFLRSTGFDYERDLNRIVIAVQQDNGVQQNKVVQQNNAMQQNLPDTPLFAVAEGNFNRAKISAYAAKSGITEKRAGYKIFSVPVNNSSRRLKFTFLRNDCIALTNEPDLVPLLSSAGKNPDTPNTGDLGDWRTRFDRLAGSPLFAVIRQAPATADLLSRQAPGGWRSPQLSALFNQLQWITLAAKPDATGLRIVSEGECTSEKTTRQLSDLLTGIVALAEGGLNDAKTRKQMNPQTREAYLELLNSVNVERIDRGTTKSVRVVLNATPKLLAIARSDHIPNPKAGVGTL